MFKVDPVVLAPEVRTELERRARSQTLPVRSVRRANMILLCAEGVPLRQVAKRVSISEHQVTLWRRRFLAEGLDGLADRPRPGRPRRLGHDERMAMAAIATSERDPEDPVATWTYFEVAEELLRRGIEVSVSQAWRILKAMDIDLSKVRGWLNRRDDPEFWGRVRDVCGLYLNPPERALVLSVDEKTSIQARELKAATVPARPGRRARREWEYIRHGVAHLVAALSVHSGEVLADIVTKNDSINFCGFLAHIDRHVDPSLEIHLILDNGASHTSKATRAWLAEHPRFVAHYTPKHASWLNQIEMFFSIISRKVLRNGSFSTRDDLIDKLMRFIANYDTTAKPFAWTYTGDPLKTDPTRGTYARRH